MSRELKQESLSRNKINGMVISKYSSIDSGQPINELQKQLLTTIAATSLMSLMKSLTMSL